MSITPHGLVTPSTALDARELASTMRPEDRREFEELGQRPALRSLLLGVLSSSPALTLRTHEGGLVGLCGVVPSGENAGVVWMGCTELVEDHRTAFLRGSLDVLRELHRSRPVLYNVCDARNDLHVRWLRWLGFTFIRKTERHSVPLYEFARIAD